MAMSASLSLKLIQFLFQRFESLPRLAELALGGQALIVGEIACRALDQRIDV